MRTRLLPIALVVVVLAAGCVGPLQTTGATPDDGTETPDGVTNATAEAANETDGTTNVSDGVMNTTDGANETGADDADDAQVATDGGTPVETETPDGPETPAEPPVDSDTERSTISVTGSGEASAEADLAVVAVSVTATADTADEARSQVATDVERMRSALDNASVPEDNVTTTTFAISPQYDYSNETPELVGYRAVHSFRIEIAPDRAGEIIDVAVGNGATQVDGVQFTLTNETRSELRAQALTRAVNDARADADAIAEASNLEITGVRSISTADEVRPFPETQFAEAGAGDAATELQPGPVVVRATVSAAYEATESDS